MRLQAGEAAGEAAQRASGECQSSADNSLGTDQCLRRVVQRVEEVLIPELNLYPGSSLVLPPRWQAGSNSSGCRGLALPRARVPLTMVAQNH